MDPALIHRVLDNLLMNALEAMPNGGTLTLALGVKGDDIVISVADTGEGIPIEVQEKIFVPLFTTKSGGFGLGLPFCKHAVAAHGGVVAFTSEVGKGTTFTATIPRIHSK